MSQSLANILVHLVFSTKNRERSISDNVREELHAYIGGIVKNCHGILLKAGSVEDHIHLLVIHPRTISPSDLVKEIKIGSSKWLKDKLDYSAFHWQGGYGMFSISPSHKNAVMNYIATQKEHHKEISFQDEFRRLLEKYGIEYDEKYMWG